MQAKDLIGKLAIRTNENMHLDYRFTNEAIKIIKVTESHIVYELPKSPHIKVNYPATMHVLNNLWIDDNWIDYEELMNITEEVKNNG
jgi:hypothetical protein